MHPALSVIFFTVASGAGFGLVGLSVALELIGASPMASRGGLFVALALGAGLATLGLLASTLHLANPRNAWRAFFRFRSSWLSREAVFSVLFFPVLLVFVAGVWHGAGGWIVVAGWLSVLLALATVFTTGMIYASLRTIPQWHNALVPANYLLLSLASGAALLATTATLVGGDVDAAATLAVVALVLGGGAKALYFQWIGRPAGSSVHTAVGMTRGRVRLLESGQSSAGFLDREFGYRPSPRLLFGLRGLVFAGFAAALALLAMLYHTGHPAFAVLAPAALLPALLVERWLFFAEARHVVNLFRGEQQC